MSENKSVIREILDKTVSRYFMEAIEAAGITENTETTDVTACVSMILHGSFKKKNDELTVRDIRRQLSNMDRLDRTYLPEKQCKQMEEEKNKIRASLNKGVIPDWMEFKNKRRENCWREVDQVRIHRNGASHITGMERTKGEKEENKTWDEKIQDDENAYDVMMDIVRALEKLQQPQGVKAVVRKMKEHFLIRNKSVYNWIPQEEFLSVFSGKGVIEAKLIASLAETGEIQNGRVNLTENSFKKLKEAEHSWREKSKGWENTDPYDLEMFLKKAVGGCVLIAKSALLERSFQNIYNQYLIPLYQKQNQPFCVLSCACKELSDQWKEMKLEANRTLDNEAIREEYRFIRRRVESLKMDRERKVCVTLKFQTEMQSSEKMTIPAAHMLRMAGPLVFISQNCEESRALFDLFQHMNLLKKSCFLRIQNDKLCGNKYYEGLV